MGEQFPLGPRGSQPGCMSLSVPRGRLCEVTETPARAMAKARFQTLSSRQHSEVKVSLSTEVCVCVWGGLKKGMKWMKCRVEEVEESWKCVCL